MSGKKDAINNSDNKPRLSLIPKEALFELGKALTHGEQRYGTHNYREGIKISYLLDAAFRHLSQFNEGENIDEQSQTNHLGNVMANCAMALYMLNNMSSFDDRFKISTSSIKEEDIWVNEKDETAMVELETGDTIVYPDGKEFKVSTEGTFPIHPKGSVRWG